MLFLGGVNGKIGQNWMKQNWIFSFPFGILKVTLKWYVLLKMSQLKLLKISLVNVTKSTSNSDFRVRKHKWFVLNALCECLIWYGSEVLGKHRGNERPEYGKINFSL